MNPETSTPLAAGLAVVVVKGCKIRDIRKGMRGIIVSVTPGERGSARVTITFGCGHYARTISLYVQHTNRLADLIVGMNDGNPLNRIQVRRS